MMIPVVEPVVHEIPTTVRTVRVEAIRPPIAKLLALLSNDVESDEIHNYI